MRSMRPNTTCCSACAPAGTRGRRGRRRPHRPFLLPRVARTMDRPFVCSADARAHQADAKSNARLALWPACLCAARHRIRAVAGLWSCPGVPADANLPPHTPLGFGPPRCPSRCKIPHTHTHTHTLMHLQVHPRGDEPGRLLLAVGGGLQPGVAAAAGQPQPQRLVHVGGPAPGALLRAVARRGHRGHGHRGAGGEGGARRRAGRR